MKILVTSGATREPIDGVRFISNLSSGKTGAVVSDVLIDKGHKVSYVHGVSAAIPLKNHEAHEFKDFVSLDLILKKLLGESHFDAIVHLAAVSDFSLSEIEIGQNKIKPGLEFKLDSKKEKMSLHLKRNFKIIERLKGYSLNSQIVVIGFKLTNSLDEKKRSGDIHKLSLNKAIDYVVHNDLSQIKGEEHLARIFKKGQILLSSETKKDLGQNIAQILESQL